MKRVKIEQAVDELVKRIDDFPSQTLYMHDMDQEDGAKKG